MADQSNIRLDVVNDHIRLAQQSTGLTFGTDAYLLSAYVRAVKGGLGVDLGSGTGIIPLLCLGRDKLSRFVAVEIQSSFADLIKQINLTKFIIGNKDVFIATIIAVNRLIINI